MDLHLSPSEAWADFYAWAKQQTFWKEMTAREKRPLYDAQADYLGRRGQLLGPRRIERILNHYAPGRYEFREVVILHDGK